MKVALVTAGFRRVGAAIASRLAEDGWTLALHARVPKEPEPDLAAVLSLHQTQWHGFYADFENDDDVAGLIPAVISHFGQAPSLIVNNASLFEFDDCSTVSAGALARHHRINAIVPVMLSTQLAQLMAAGAAASVVNITDQRVRQPNADQLSYTLSKQSLAAATELLARALAPQVRVNAVAPGLTLPTGDYRPAQMVQLQAMMPLKRLPEPQDVADAVVWLANAESTTGQTICVDGGAAMKSFDRDFVFLGNEN